MPIANVLSASGLGGVEKARLTIYKAGSSDPMEGMNTVQRAEASLSNAVGTAVGSGVLNQHEMQVQYNPSSLTFQANAENAAFTYLQQSIDQGVPNQSIRPPSIILSVELVFDAMNPQDAFMMDKARLSAGTVVSQVSAIKKTVMGGHYTVQPQTEGLLAALLRQSTRMVKFHWADMSFTGQLTEAQAEYTMFSVSGFPVRSHVRINISQQVESAADVAYWNGVLDKMFEKSTTVMGKSFAQKVGNLVNLDSF